MKSMKALVILIFVLILAVSFISCSNNSTEKAETTSVITQQVKESTTNSAKEIWIWQKDTPENQGIDSDDLAAVHSIYNTFPLLSAVIIKNDKIIDEYYKDGNNETSQFVLNSASKSVTSQVLQIMDINGGCAALAMLIMMRFLHRDTQDNIFSWCLKLI